MTTGVLIIAGFAIGFVCVWVGLVIGSRNTFNRHKSEITDGREYRSALNRAFAGLKAQEFNVELLVTPVKKPGVAPRRLGVVTTKVPSQGDEKKT